MECEGTLSQNLKVLQVLHLARRCDVIVLLEADANEESLSLCLRGALASHNLVFLPGTRDGEGNIRTDSGGVAVLPRKNDAVLCTEGGTASLEVAPG